MHTVGNGERSRSLGNDSIIIIVIFLCKFDSKTVFDAKNFKNSFWSAKTFFVMAVLLGGHRKQFYQQISQKELKATSTKGFAAQFEY
jgi:hypothetical protein